ncbi:prolyl oligopeptidase family serine peptidase [Blastopirellula marina]|uniref:Phospholipase n=1 Tax=Blastopirellula marina TaxID=124 RepID=A0A2S8GPB9_9BACT|nr:prolyl oligopeptidase family serine peptidase [Blastopirellula marina]PQO46293.1 phospholipase [Blastopirellula marina]
MKAPLLRSALLLLLCLSAAPLLAADDDQEPARQSEESFEYVQVRKLKFLLYLPQGYEEKESWPLVLFLHGAGERGDNLELVKKHGPPKLIEEGKNFPFIVVAPQCPKDTWWSKEDLVALLDHIMEIRNVDDNRVYVTGLSMGGLGTWQVAGAIPEKLAAIAPICGLKSESVVEKIAEIPTWVFHGAKDQAVKIDNSDTMVRLLKEEGAEPKYTVYPEAGHDSWTEAYNTEELYTWLLSHELKDRQKKEQPADTN